jgi:hypothetical protein
VTRGGGIAGLVQTTTADVAWLSPRDGQEMQALVSQAGLLGDPPASATGKPAPDQFNYTVTVEDDGRQHVARFSDQSMPEPVRNLITWVSTVDGHREDVGPARPLPPAGGAGPAARFYDVDAAFMSLERVSYQHAGLVSAGMAMLCLAAY